MAALAASSITGSGAQAVTPLVLGASDTFVFKPNVKATLIFNNVSGGALTPLIVGSTATTEPCSGLGDITVSGGYQLASVANGATVAIQLDSISGYLKGVLTITGGDAMQAQLFEYA